MDTTQVERRRTRVVGLVKSHLEFLGGQAKTLKFNFVFLFRNTEISWIDNPEGMELESKIFDCFAVSDVWITVRLLKMRAIRKRSTYDHLSWQMVAVSQRCRHHRHNGRRDDAVILFVVRFVSIMTCFSFQYSTRNVFFPYLLCYLCFSVHSAALLSSILPSYIWLGL